MRAQRGMGSDGILASPTFLQALSPAERKRLLKQLSDSSSWWADVPEVSVPKACRSNNGVVNSKLPTTTLIPIGSSPRVILLHC